MFYVLYEPIHKGSDGDSVAWLTDLNVKNQNDSISQSIFIQNVSGEQHDSSRGVDPLRLSRCRGPS